MTFGRFVVCRHLKRGYHSYKIDKLVPIYHELYIAGLNIFGTEFGPTQIYTIVCQIQYAKIRLADMNVVQLNYKPLRLPFNFNFIKPFIVFRYSKLTKNPGITS